MSVTENRAATTQPCPWCERPISRAYADYGRTCEHCGKPLVYVIGAYALGRTLRKRSGLHWIRRLPFCNMHPEHPRPTCHECIRTQRERTQLEAS